MRRSPVIPLDRTKVHRACGVPRKTRVQQRVATSSMGARLDVCVRWQSPIARIFGRVFPRSRERLREAFDEKARARNPTQDRRHAARSSRRRVARTHSTCGVANASRRTGTQGLDAWCRSRDRCSPPRPATEVERQYGDRRPGGERVGPNQPASFFAWRARVEARSSSRRGATIDEDGPRFRSNRARDEGRQRSVYSG